MGGAVHGGVPMAVMERFDMAETLRLIVDKRITIVFAVPPVLLAMANLFLRDVKYLFEIVLTVWMFATSVVYPVDNIGGKLGMIIKLNPLTPMIDGYRSTILRGEPPQFAALAVSALLAVVTFAVAWVTFHRAEYTFAERA